MADDMLAHRLAAISRSYDPGLQAVRGGHWQHGWIPLDQVALKEKYHGHAPADAVPFVRQPNAGRAPAGLKQRTFQVTDLAPGDKVFTHGEWVHVIGHPEDTKDRFGQSLKRIKARRDNGKEGYLLYGPGASVLGRRPHASFRKPYKQAA